MWLHIRGVGEWTNTLYSYFEKEQMKLHRGDVLPVESFIKGKPMLYDDFYNFQLFSSKKSHFKICNFFGSCQSTKPVPKKEPKLALENGQKSMGVDNPSFEADSNKGSMSSVASSAVYSAAERKK